MVIRRVFILFVCLGFILVLLVARQAASAQRFTVTTPPSSISWSESIPGEPGVWQSNGPRGGQANALAVSPNFATDGLAFAGEWFDGRYGDQSGSGIFKSTDHGQTWNSSSAGTGNEYYSSALHDYAFSPNFASDQTLFAATWGALYRSTNGGAAWTLVDSLYSGPPGWFFEVAVAPDFASSGHMIVSGGPQGMSVSQDGGATWTGSSPIVTELTYSPDFAADHQVFGAGYQGFYESVDGGLTWTQVLTAEMTAVAISPDFAVDHTLWGGRSQLYISNDGGATWMTRTLSAETTYLQDIAVSPQFSTDHTLFAGTNDGLYWSNDGGLNWTAVPEYAGQTVHKLAISPQWPTHPVLLVGTNTGVYRLLATDLSAGVVKAAAQGLTVLDTNVLALGANDSLLLVGAANHGVFGSVNDGATWQPQGLQFSGGYYSIASLAISPDFAADQTLLATRASGVSIGGSIYRSLDSGATWQNVYNTDYTGSVTFSPSFAQDATIFATGNNGRVISSTNGGDDWTQLPNWPPDLGSRAIRLAVPPNYPADGRLFVGSDNGFWFTPDGGATWTPATSGLISGYRIDALFVSPGFVADNTLLAIASWSDPAPLYTQHHAVFRSSDGGLNWLPAQAGLPDAALNGLGLSPHFATDQTVYATTEFELYRSTDGGQNWSLVGSPPGEPSLRKVVVDQTGLVFVSSSLGVWRYQTLLRNVIVNGGFEGNGGWDLPVTPVQGRYSEAVVNNGRWAMQLGLDDEPNVYGYSSARQLITVPPDVGLARLSFYLYPVAEATTPVNLPALFPTNRHEAQIIPVTGDVQYVLLLDPVTADIEVVLHWDLSNAQTWQLVTVNLVPYAGHSFLLHFGAYNDGDNGRTALYVDDVSLLLLEPDDAPFGVYLPMTEK